MFSVDPQAGARTAYLASELHLAPLIPDADGDELYVLDVRDPAWTSVALVRLDAATGQLFAKRKLVSGVWFIALATVPKELVPSGQVEAITK